jgi:hypothetical protein
VNATVLAAVLTLALPAGEPLPATQPASQPASRPAFPPGGGPSDPELKLVETPLPWPVERSELTRAYRLEQYGQAEAGEGISPRIAIIHVTGVGTLEGSLALYRPVRADALPEPLRARSALGASVHAVIDSDGTVHQTLAPHLMARHAVGVNHVSAGIALVGERGPAVTDAQLDAVVALLNHWGDEGHTITWLFGHHEVESLRGTRAWAQQDESYRAHMPDPGEAVMAKLAQRGRGFGFLFASDLESEDEASDFEWAFRGTLFPYDEERLKERSLTELILLRNGIFAAYGRRFPDRPWVQKHFDAQPDYKPYRFFEEMEMTLTDRDNVRLIAKVERDLSKAELERRQQVIRAKARSARTPADTRELALLDEYMAEARWREELAAWEPGAKVRGAWLSKPSFDDLLDFYIRMTMKLDLGGMEDGPCEEVQELRGIDGVCDVWLDGGTPRKKLARTDRRSLAKVERALALRRIDEQMTDPIHGCYADCAYTWNDEDLAEGPSPPKEVKRCRAECRVDMAEERSFVREDKAALKETIEYDGYARGVDLVFETIMGGPGFEGFG